MAWTMLDRQGRGGPKYIRKRMWYLKHVWEGRVCTVQEAFPSAALALSQAARMQLTNWGSPPQQPERDFSYSIWGDSAPNVSDSCPCVIKQPCSLISLTNMQTNVHCGKCKEMAGLCLKFTISLPFFSVQHYSGHQGPMVPALPFLSRLLEDSGTLQ